MLNWLKQANEKSLRLQAESPIQNLLNADVIVKAFRSQNAETLDAIKYQIIQVFESGDLVSQQEFIRQYTPKFSIKAQLIKALKGSPEWGVAALSANAQDYAHKRPYELGAVLGDVCYQLASKALQFKQPGVPARYLYFGGQGAQSCVISLKQMNRNRDAITYLDQVIPCLEQYEETEILPALLLHRVDANFELQRYEEADRLLQQIKNKFEKLPPVDQQTYNQLRCSVDKKLQPPIIVSSAQLSESEQVLITLKQLVAHVEPLLPAEPEAQNDFAQLETLLQQLEQKKHLTASDFSMALKESKSMSLLKDLMAGQSGSITASAMISTITATFTKLLEISRSNESKS